MCFRKIYTLAVVLKGNKILLGFKKRGFGAGKWNGFGGKVEAGESILDAAVRELHEESGIIAEVMENVGVIDFEFEGEPTIMEVHIFKTDKWHGDIKESDEMIPKWHPIDNIPYEKMWADDQHWLPLVLQGCKVKAYFLFQGQSKILKHDVKVID